MSLNTDHRLVNPPVFNLTSPPIMASVEPSTNADAGPSQPRPTDAQQPANITVLANRRFPVPPSYYTEFTPDRWKRYTQITRHGGDSAKGKEKEDAEDMIVDSKPDDQSRDMTDSDGLAIFQPPRIDWIKRESTWNAFGRVYEVCSAHVLQDLQLQAYAASHPC
jgi:hypothetical protein